MIAIDNKNFIKQYFNALSGQEKTSTLIDQYVSDQDLKDHIKFFENAFPKYRMIVEDLICEEEKVVVRAIAKGKHLGNLSEIPPTGKEIELPFIVIYYLEDGKISKSWIETNHMELMNQLGIDPMNN